MTEPRLRREAVVAQLADELDVLLARVERLAPVLAATSERIEGQAGGLTDALEQHRAGVNAVSTQILKNIAEFAVRRTNEAAAKSIETQQAAMQEAARQAFETELASRVRELSDIVARAAQEAKRPGWSGWVEHAATALLSAAVTAAGVLYLVRG